MVKGFTLSGLGFKLLQARSTLLVPMLGFGGSGMYIIYTQALKHTYAYIRYMRAYMPKKLRSTV